jgi:hypothetical protein
MLINLRNALMAGKRLPYDAEVEYLGTTGGQYINTGIIGGSATKVEITAYSTNTSTFMTLFGARNTSNGNRPSYSIWQRASVANITRMRFDYNSASADSLAGGDWNASTVNTITKDNVSNYINGTLASTNIARSFSLDIPFYLGTINGSGTPATYYFVGRIYSCKLWDANGVLVRDFIPVRKGTVGYLYDRVSGKLFGNAGTGDFVLGPDVVPVEYLQANNTSYSIGSTIGGVIDTGIVANLDTDVWVCDAQFVSFGNTAGCWGRVGDRFAFGRGSTSWNDWYYGFGDTNNRTSKKYDNNRHVFVLDGPNRRLTIDGVSYSGSGTAVAGSLTLAIFNRNCENGISYCADNSNSRCYSAKLYRSDVLMQDLIPVRVGTDATSWEGAMMDVLTRRIYRNAGTGAFTYGNDLKYPIPAE